MRLGFFLAVGLALLPGSGCGGTAVAGSEAPPGYTTFDASAQDGGVTADATQPDAALTDTVVIEATPDAPPGEFCSGDVAKIGVAGSVVLAPTLTTSPLIMNCCEGVVVAFHLGQQLGYNVLVTVRAFGAMQPGTYVLGDEPGGIEVSARKEFDNSEGNPATGTLRVDTDYPEPRRLGFCLETPGGDVLGPLRMYVPQVLTAPYEWQSRWGLYLLSDPGITANDALEQPIGGLALASEPIVHLMSIAYYEHATHKAVWGSWSTTQWLLNSLPQVGLEGLPFVLVAGGERIYVGAFTTAISSIMVDAPSIETMSIPEEGFTIQAPPMAPDPRSDPRILKVLAEAVKLAP